MFLTDTAAASDAVEKALPYIGVADVRRILPSGLEIVVEEDSYAEGRSIRSVLWPAQGLVTEVCPPCGECFVPDGKTVLSAGDRIAFECVAASEEDVKSYLSDIVCAAD